MGQIIKLDNFGGSYPEVLTSTGQGGFLSPGYLRDRPAVSAIEADETPQFVLTNKKNGVTIHSERATEYVRPGSGYRTIAVLTDRRLLLFVGDCEDGDGDRHFAIPFAEIETVDTESSLREGRLGFQRAGGTRWVLHAARDGLTEVADYLDEAAQRWIRVENLLDDVTRQVVLATELRDAGEYDAALTAAQRASDLVEEALSVAEAFGAERNGDAMASRVEVVRERCLRTLSSVRLKRARGATEDGERYWRDDEYEDAYDAYERARSEYEAVLSLDLHLADIDDLLAERDRLDRLVEQLEESPLRKAVAADNEASASDDPETAAEFWELALTYYRTALEVDWGADERRFAGDPTKIRERLGAVAENLTAAQRAVGSDAMGAGDWYADAEQYEQALAEYETAAKWYEAALETARDCYPTAIDHLETEREALGERVERVEAAVAGEPITDRIDADIEPDYDVSATIGSPDADGEPVDTAEDAADEQSAQGVDSEDPSEQSPEGGNAVPANQPAGDAEPTDSTDAAVRGVAPSPDPADGVAGKPAMDDDGGQGLRSAPVDSAARAAGTTDVEAAIDAVETGGAPAQPTQVDTSNPMAERLRSLSRPAFVETVTSVLDATGWRAAPAADGAGYDLLAESTAEDGGPMAVVVAHPTAETLDDPARIDDCVALCARTAEADRVMLATSGRLGTAVARAAREADVALMDDETLSTILETRGIDPTSAERPEDEG